MSPGLQRARAPYRVKNALLGLTLGAFAVGIWAYSISAVKQDVFDDIDDEAKALREAGVGANKTGAAAVAGTTGSTTVGLASTSTTTQGLVEDRTKDLVKLGGDAGVVERTESTRGLLQHLDQRFPWLLDPQRKTFVWGAPPVDNVGKMHDTSSSSSPSHKV
jgi:cytochrome c oxidase assembly factor 3